tara:strand:- start:8 stop:229 length:222 start_codon:yes stop_codon:yes gene_type:complete
MDVYLVLFMGTTTLVRAANKKNAAKAVWDLAKKYTFNGVPDGGFKANYAKRDTVSDGFHVVDTTECVNTLTVI